MDKPSKIMRHSWVSIRNISLQDELSCRGSHSSDGNELRGQIESDLAALGSDDSNIKLVEFEVPLNNTS